MKRIISTTPPDPKAVAQLAQSAYYNALLRTTCVATRLEAGHADNALPQLARATVNCRVLPVDSIAQVESTLIKVLADDQIHVSKIEERNEVSPASQLTPEVLRPVESVTHALWPGLPIVPVMETGATDSKYLRTAGIPAYGVSGIFSDVDDVRAHGRDERVNANAFFEGREFIYQLVRRMSSE
jgi:acetylornithine deacetylase/succinyl-diaminopimelate desuccinylase-like protein